MTSGGHHLELMELVDRLPTAAVLKTEERLYANERVARLTGYCRDELRSLDAWMDALHGDGAGEARQLYEADRSDGFPVVRIITIRHKDGAERWVEYASYRQFDAELWLLRDMTGLWQQQARLNAENESLKTLIDDNTEKLFHTVNHLLDFHQQLKKERQKLKLLSQIAARQRALLETCRCRPEGASPLLEQLAVSLHITASCNGHPDPLSQLEREWKRLDRLPSASEDPSSNHEKAGS